MSDPPLTPPPGGGGALVQGLAQIEAVELGVVSPALFAMVVLMALATTMAAGPAMSWLNRKADARPEGRG